MLGRGRDGDRVLDQDRRLRRDVVDVLTLLVREDRLVLVREQDVSLAGEECLQRFARARRLRDDVLSVERRQVCDRLLRRLASSQRTSVRGHRVPARATRRERIRGHHLHARLEEVVPGADALRIATTDDEDDDRASDDSVPPVLVPVRVDEMLLDERVQIGRERDGTSPRFRDGCVRGSRSWMR